MSNQEELYTVNDGFSDKASLDDIKIMIAKQVKTYQDSIVRVSEAQIKLREANATHHTISAATNRMWQQRGHWLNREVRRV